MRKSKIRENLGNEKIRENAIPRINWLEEGPKALVLLAGKELAGGQLFPRAEREERVREVLAFMKRPEGLFRRLVRGSLPYSRERKAWGPSSLSRLWTNFPSLGLRRRDPLRGSLLLRFPARLHQENTLSHLVRARRRSSQKKKTQHEPNTRSEKSQLCWLFEVRPWRGGDEREFKIREIPPPRELCENPSLQLISIERWAEINFLEFPDFEVLRISRFHELMMMKEWFSSFSSCQSHNTRLAVR